MRFRHSTGSCWLLGALAPALAIALAWAPPAAADLPAGAQPAPAPIEHFPDPLHAVVFRNWGLVSTARIARTVGATEAQIEAIAASMGLPPAAPPPPRFKRQMYITILRRNWHLLPYDQLLTLLDMSESELAFAMREDDFLYIKLGSLKPRCAPVRYAAPDAAAQSSEADIRRWVQTYFGAALGEAGEPRLAFIDQLRSPLKRAAPIAPAPANDSPRFIYSYFGVFGDPLLNAAADPYPDGLLERLAAVGVNGVWLHVVLRQLAPGGADFPEFGRDHETRLANLNRLVQRARRHGIAVYLYMNEPRAQPAAFFKDRPDMAGVREGDHVAMCTSDPRVRRWLTAALAHVFTAVPDLGGVFTITASENLTNCASHGRRQQCPRCAKRTDAQIIGEVNTAIARGVHQGNPKARVFAWDWGWAGHGVAPQHIAALPADVWLMSVSEWAKPIVRGGVSSTVGEYSLSAVGPGPRALEEWRLARQRGLKTLAKVQLNATWELSAVPFLPVLDLVADHCANLSAAGVDGLMLSWSVGGYPSPNLQVAQMMLGPRRAAKDEALDAIAAQRYGQAAAADARRAWSRFSTAFTQFPYHVNVLYRGPQQFGPANLLYRQPTGYRSTMIGFPYDDVNGWRGPYPPAVLASQFQKVADGWADGLKDMQRVVDAADPAHRADAEADLRIASAAQLHFASAANQVRFVMARDALGQPGATDAQQRDQRAAIVHILDDEIAIARKLYDLAKADSRIGFEASNQYYYTPQDLVEKVVNCAWLRRHIAR